jgi:endonuclease/exonuclease/phosphatase family metal-dependent hydrolase
LNITGKTKLSLLFSFTILLLVSCDPLVTEFPAEQMATEYTAKTLTAPPNKDTLTVVTWNIRFGIGRAEWFGDSCGELVLFDTDEIQDGLELLAAKITAMGADILLLQEVDTDSKRSAYVDQVQWLLDNTEFNYGVYASMWEVQFVPSDGLGRVNTGNAILSHWPLSEAERIQLSLRGDQDALTRAFYVRRNVLRAKVNYPGSPFWAVDIHASAFSNDDTKQKQYLEFKAVLDELNAQGENFVAGGDLNELPPGAAKNNYCDNDRCPGESAEDDEGCDFSNETTWISPLFDSYIPGVSLVNYLQDENRHFTHASAHDANDERYQWNRKLDYLFTNTDWVPRSTVTHQDAVLESDHVAVAAKWVVP